MKKKAIKRDFFVEIKKSLNRFVSIILIVALGVAFFAGIRAAKPDMKITADYFYDKSNLMDIRVLSTLGLTEDDVTALKAVNGVDDVEPAYSVDVLCRTDDYEYVLKVMSKTDSMNQINILTGRLPENINECLVDEQFLNNTGFKIGDTIALSSGTDKELNKSLKNDNYTIVGVGSSSYYLSFDRGSSSIGNGKINNFIIVPKETFELEAYTEIYVSVAGAKELTSYTELYDDKVEAVVDGIKDIADSRKEARYQEILVEPTKEINDGKKELNENEDKVNKELADAKEKIDDAKIEIADGEKAIADAKVELNDGKKEIEDNKKKLTDSQAKLDDGKRELDSADAELKSGKKVLAEKRSEWQVGQDALKNGYKQWNDSMDQWNKSKAELDKNEKTLDDALKEITTQKEQLEPAKDLYPDQWQQLITTEESLLTQQQQLNAGKTELERGLTKLNAAKTELDKKQKEVDKADVLLTKEEQKITNGEATIATKRAEIVSGQNEINTGWSEINKAETKIQDSEKLLADKEKELKEGKETLLEKEQEYLDGKEKAESELADARKKIADAEEKLRDVEYPKWYVLDRNTIQTYVEFGQDSERIGNIGKVFPVIFFLVAALVSLTTMTRMVEEQRTQIGTYKALGYSKSSIAGKYILYAFLASMLGSIIGVLIGEKILPSVIINAYKILYHNLPDAQTPYNLFYAIMSTAVAVLCTTLAAFLACYKELMTTPAELMRPAAPKLGKRVILERIPWLWKHFNFTTKSTIRNLLRYKKRFFMTVFGIGGCMALLLVGFGLKDSISAMSDIQYVELWHQDSIVVVDDKANENEVEELHNWIQTDSRFNDTINVHEVMLDASNGKTSKSTTLIVPEDTVKINNYIEFRDRVSKKHYDLTDDGIIITEKLASLLKVKVGDTIELKDGDVSTVSVKVAHITENYMLHYIFMSPQIYEKLYGEKPEYNRIYTKNTEDTKEFEESVAKEILELPAVTSISFTTELQKRISDMLNNLNLVIYVLIISAGLLAFVVLYNLNNININERKRELATLKVLGFQDTEVATYVYRENVMLTLIGAIAGIFLGMILHRFVILTAEIDTFMFGRNIHVISYLLSALLTFGFSVFVNFVMFYKLRKIDMVESLKSVE